MKCWCFRTAPRYTIFWGDSFAFLCNTSLVFIYFCTLFLSYLPFFSLCYIVVLKVANMYWICCAYGGVAWNRALKHFSRYVYPTYLESIFCSHPIREKASHILRWMYLLFYQDKCVVVSLLLKPKQVDLAWFARFIRTFTIAYSLYWIHCKQVNSFSISLDERYISHIWLYTRTSNKHFWMKWFSTNNNTSYIYLVRLLADKSQNESESNHIKSNRIITKVPLN